MMRVVRCLLVLAGCSFFGLLGCAADEDGDKPAPVCALDSDLSAADAPDFSHVVGCQADFDLLAQLPSFAAMRDEQGQTHVTWAGPRRPPRAAVSPPASGELSFDDYMHATRWFMADADIRDRILRAIFHAISDGSAMEVSDLRAAVDPNEDMTDKQWYGTLFSLKCGGGLYEHPDGNEHSMNDRRVSLFRGVEHEDEFRVRYYTSLFHKAYGERDDLTPERCAELLYGDESDTKIGLFTEVFDRLARRR